MLNILISAALVILATYTQRLRAEIPVFDLEDPSDRFPTSRSLSAN
jgi:hypothetical protein